MSPLVQQLGNEQGYANIYGGFLPRPAQTFTEGAFSPFSPIMPVPIDAPPEGFERAQPRRFQYRTGYNLPTGEPGSEEGYKLAPFSVLKNLSKSYSIARRCIQLVKKEVCGLEWDITLTSHAEKAYQGDHAAMRDFGERRARAMKFFRKPDPNYFDFTSWLSAGLEQILSIDALSLYMCPKKGTGMGQGLLGSDLDSLWCIDGESIRPLLSLSGGIPMPPAPAYQQYEYGVPRADFTTVIAGLDLPELAGSEVRPYRGDQLMYLPMVPFPDSPYGFGPTEQALVPIMTGLRKQGYQLEFFTEGTVPAVYISPGDNSMTPNQIRELQDALNSVANDQAFHWKVIVLPPGSKTMPQKPNDIVDQSDEWIANEVCMMYGVSPMDVGILPKVSTVASPFAAREMAQASRTSQEKTDTKPLLKFLAAIPNFILQVVCDQPDMEFAFEGQREVADEAAITDMMVKQAQIGVRSVDEFRDKIGLPPWGLPESSGPVVFTPMGPIPLTDAVQIASATAQQKALPPGSSSSGGKKKPAASARSLPGGTNTARQRQRGGAALTPAHAASEGFMPERTRTARAGSAGPAHAQASVKASLAELEALTRHLRKGREISTWEVRYLPSRALSMLAENIAKGMPAEQAAGIVKAIVLPPASYQWVEKAQQQNTAQQQQQALAQQYAKQIQAAFASAAAAAAKLIAQWAAGKIAVTAAVLASLIAAEVRKALSAALSGLWADAWAHGEAEAGGSAGGALEAFLGTIGRQVEEWVSGTNLGDVAKALRDLAGLKRKARIAALLDLLEAAERAELIAVTEVVRAWWSAVLAVWKMLGIAYKGWQTRNDGKVCKACKTNQDQGFIPLGAVFSSGDAAPGAHPRCRCKLITPPPGWTPPVTVGKAKRRGVNLDGEVVLSDDPEGGNPAGGGGRTLYPHRADGTEIPGGVPGSSAGGEPPRWDASTPERRGYVNDYGEDDADWPDRGRDPAPRPDEDWPDGGDEDEDLWPEGGHGTAQPPATSIGDGPRGRAPNAMGKTAEPKGALADLLAAAPKAKSSAVRKQLLGNFPSEAVAWVNSAKWHGPTEVPLELTDFRADRTWAAAHQMDHVARFARDLKAGRKVDPVVAVALPDHRHVRIVDGHHRAMACKKLGWPVRAYIGHVSGKATRDAAYQTHSSQLHQGDDPANKAAGYALSPRSGMISLDLPEGLIESMPGGVDDHHITVVYLGKDVDDDLLDHVLMQARTVARRAPGPLAGLLSGIGSFPPSDGSDGMVPAFIPARIPGAEWLRAGLEHLSASEHKDWAPHVTLAYLEPGEPLPDPHPPVPVTFTHLSVHRGGEVYRFPLGGRADVTGEDR
jgi:2'-5' RNA ligase